MKSIKFILILYFSLFVFHFSFGQQATIQLSATGQITSYYPGDDGDLQMGVPIPANRFNDNGDGSITDIFSGMMWGKDANLIATRNPSFDQDRTPGDGDIDWKTALDYLQFTNYNLQSVRIEIIDFNGSVPESSNNRTIEQWNNGTGARHQPSASRHLLHQDIFR